MLPNSPSRLIDRSLILVVDDIDANARLLKRLLTDDGYEVLIAGGGEAALDMVAQHCA